MSSHLTTRQRAELHAAMLDYLGSNEQFAESCAAFRREAGLEDAPAATGREKGLLVKKWTSIVRLSKQVADLKTKLEQAESSGGLGGPGALDRERGRMLPVLQPPAATFEGHRKSVTCVRVHPKFGLAASASDDTMIKVWDLEAEAQLATLRGHTKAVTHLAFSPRGDLLASASSDLSVKLWGAQGSTYTCTKTLNGHEHTVSCVEFVPSGDLVLSSSRDNTIKVWEVATGYCVRTLSEHTEWVRCLAVSPDGKMLASGGNDQVVVLWSLESHSPVQRLRGHEHFIQAVAFSRQPLRLEDPNGSTPAANGATEEKVAEGGGAAAEGGGAVNEAVMLVASAGRDSTVRVWNAEVGTLLFVLADHGNWVNDLTFHPNGKYLLSAADDRAVKVLDLNKRRCLRSLDEAHGHFVTSVALAPHIARLVSAGVDGQVRVWECR